MNQDMKYLLACTLLALKSPGKQKHKDDCLLFSTPELVQPLIHINDVWLCAQKGSANAPMSIFSMDVLVIILCQQPGSPCEPAQVFKITA
jgi:hypothetical protein